MDEVRKRILNDKEITIDIELANQIEVFGTAIRKLNAQKFFLSAYRSGLEATWQHINTSIDHTLRIEENYGKEIQRW